MLDACPAAMGLWTVVSPGVLVRTACELQSAREQQRLLRGALVEEARKLALRMSVSS